MGEEAQLLGIAYDDPKKMVPIKPHEQQARKGKLQTNNTSFDQNFRAHLPQGLGYQSWRYENKKAWNAIAHDSGRKIFLHECYNKIVGPTIVFKGDWRRGWARGAATAGGRIAAGNAPSSNDRHGRSVAGYSGGRLRRWGAGAAQHGVADSGRGTYAKGEAENRH